VPSDNVATVQRLIEALNGRDLERYLDLCRPDVELISPLSPLEGPNVGPAGVTRFFAAIEEGAKRFRIEIDEFEDVGDGRVLAFGRIDWTSQGGISLDRPLANLYELEDGRLRRVHAYTEPGQARAAAGLG
jgi:ketosteroid isomerase-like protein